MMYNVGIYGTDMCHGVNQIMINRVGIQKHMKFFGLITNTCIRPIDEQ
jgi:hypothetical protein